MPLCSTALLTHIKPSPQPLRQINRRDSWRELTREHKREDARSSLATQATKSKESLDVVIPESSYRIPLVLLGGSAAGFIAENYTFGGILGFLGLFLAFQSTHLKFQFSRTTLEITTSGRNEKTDNAFVGGENKWALNTFVNWEIFWPKFPILVYFKETQTKPEGQIHFFPVIFNAKQLYDVMVERCGPSQNSMPK